MRIDVVTAAAINKGGGVGGMHTGRIVNWIVYCCHIGGGFMRSVVAFPSIHSFRSWTFLFFTFTLLCIDNERNKGEPSIRTLSVNVDDNPFA